MIATKLGFIYFIEVKLRDFKSSHKPKEAVVVSKQKKIVRTAIIFLSKHKTSLQPKFSVIEIVKQKDGNFLINFLDNAFTVLDEFELFKNFNY